jgi:competence protein ComEA
LDEKVIDRAGMMDINSAELKELTTLPGIGVKTAEKIINKRNEMGRYNALEDIMLVPGIGRQTCE